MGFQTLRVSVDVAPKSIANINPTSFQTLRVSVDDKESLERNKNAICFQTLRVSVDVNKLGLYTRRQMLFPDTTCIG